MALQTLGLGLLGFRGNFLAASLILGVRTTMVYPTMLAAVSDRAGSSVGGYRFWRDRG